MRTNKEYNGHPSWNYWNVSLWINSTYHLYKTACALIEEFGNRKEAAMRLWEAFLLQGITHTPDGAKYTKAAIYHAIKDINR